MLGLLALGYMNPEIAEQLVLSVRTVETHRANIQRKTGLATRADLIGVRRRARTRQALAGDRASRQAVRRATERERFGSGSTDSGSPFRRRAHIELAAREAQPALACQ